MCGVTVASFDVVAAHDIQLGGRLTQEDLDTVDRITAALWRVASQPDLVRFWQEEGAVCRDYYELGGGTFEGGVLKAACTMFADRTVVDRAVTKYLRAVEHHIKGAPTIEETFDKLLLKWRFLDATHMQAGILRDGVRDAFEAIWTAREYASAYTYIDTLCLNIELLKEMP